MSQVVQLSGRGKDDDVQAGCSFWQNSTTNGGEQIGGKKKTREYKSPEVDDTIVEFSRKKFAPQSKHKMKWAIGLYNGWRSNRIFTSWPSMQIVRADLNEVEKLKSDDLCYAMCRFVREIKKINGHEYPPNTIRELVIMVQMYLNERGIYWKLLEHEGFVNLRNVVDNTMKERHSMGLGVRTSADVISLNHENLLFEKGVLGEENPTKLLKTVIYMIGMHCALRGGMEHSNLRRPGCESQLNISVDNRGVECLVYKEDPLQKTNQGGLVCKGRSKMVHVYPATDKTCCPVRIFKKYVALLPETKTCKKLYLRVRKKVTPKVWYCDQPYGLNKVKSTVKDICKEAGLEGKFTNHSLRAMCASRMYSNEIPEQLIKEITGHRSECVRTYKRTSDKLKESASRTLSVQTQENVKEEEKLEESIENNADDKSNLSVSRMIQNVNETKKELRRKKFQNAKARLSLLRFRRRNKLTIDVNVKINK